MTSNKTGDTKGSMAEILRMQQERGKGYRERALKLFPKICGHCGRGGGRGRAPFVGFWADLVDLRQGEGK